MDFIQEYLRLQKRMPRIGSIRLNPINSEYTHNTADCKNCYLLANAVKNEDCYYGRDFYSNQDCTDCDHILGCTLCYECVNSKNCYESAFLQDSDDCQNCDYGYDLKGCRDCIGCVGLRRQSHHIFNVPYAPEAYAAKKKTLTRKEIIREFDVLKAKTPRRFATLIDAENCTGDYIHHSKNALASYDIMDCQDVGYIEECKKVRDSYDITILEDSTLCYDCSSNHILYNCNFCFACVNSSDLEYCELVMNSKNCFGCISVNHAEYRILNQQYSKDEYFKTAAEIKDQMQREGSYGRWLFPSTYPLEDTLATWERF